MQLEFVTSTTGDFRPYSDWTLTVSCDSNSSLWPQLHLHEGKNVKKQNQTPAYQSSSTQQKCPPEFGKCLLGQIHSLPEVLFTPVVYNCSTTVQFTPWAMGEVCGIAEKPKGCKNARSPDSLSIIWSSLQAKQHNSVSMTKATGLQQPPPRSAFPSLQSSASLCDLIHNIPLSLWQRYFSVSSLS